MYSQERTSSALAKSIFDFDLVYLDTCSLLEDFFPVFMDDLAGAMWYKTKKDKLKVIVLRSVVAELIENSKKEKRELSIAAKRALKIVRHASSLRGKRVIKIQGKKVKFADPEISSAVHSQRLTKRILVITQDRTLATDIRRLNGMDSQRAPDIIVMRIKSTSGELEETPSETTYSYGRNYSEGNKGTYRSRLNPTPTGQNQQKTAAPAEHATILTQAAKDLLAFDKEFFNSYKTIGEDSKKLEFIERYQTLKAAVKQEELSKIQLKNSSYFISKQLKAIHERQEKPTPAPTPATTPLEPNPANQRKKTSKSFYASGKTAEEALRRAGEHFGIIFREPTVEYVAAVHGPYDLTSSDLKKAVEEIKNAPAANKSAKLGELVIAKLAKDGNAFKGTIEILAPQAPKPVEEHKSEPIGSEPAKPAEAPKPAKKPREAKPKTAEKPAEKKAETAEKPAKTAKKPAEAEKQAEPAKEPAITNPELFKKAKKAEMVLKANINNPNYPDESKLNAIAEHEALLAQLTPDELKLLKVKKATLTRNKKAILAKMEEAKKAEEAK